MSAPYCATNQAIMAQAALLAAWGLPLPENVLHQIVGELQGHIWYPPQEDLTLSDDEEGEIELVPNQSPGPIDSDDDMPVAEAWRRKLAAPVQPPARKRARRTVVYSDPESDSESDASDLEDLITLALSQPEAAARDSLVAGAVRSWAPAERANLSNAMSDALSARGASIQKDAQAAHERGEDVSVAAAQLQSIVSMAVQVKVLVRDLNSADPGTQT